MLNQGQQLRLAGALGSTLSGLQSLLGFGGPSGKIGFADGGEVNDWLPKFFSQFAQHFGREFRHMFGEDPTFANKLYGAFAPILGDLYFGIRQFVACDCRVRQDQQGLQAGRRASGRPERSPAATRCNTQAECSGARNVSPAERP